MEVKDLFEKRLLRKIKASPEKSKSSLQVSESKLMEAKELYNSGFYQYSILACYTSMFHACRSLLYKEGVQEKSHYAVYVYIEEKYSNKIPRELINSLNKLRQDRNEILYGFEQKVSVNENELYLEDTEEILNETKKIL